MVVPEVVVRKGLRTAASGNGPERRSKSHRVHCARVFRIKRGKISLKWVAYVSDVITRLVDLQETGRATFLGKDSASTAIDLRAVDAAHAKFQRQSRDIRLEK